jgi:diguanylate cyclase (GGDEF)-like protein
VIAVPLVVHDKLLGAITVGSPVDTRPFNEHDARLSELFAQQAAIAIQNAKLFAEIQRLATLDPLTGVHNRRYFFDRAQQELKRSLRYASDMSVILLDVDHFKSINDRFGHPRGDETLCMVARLCQEETRECDLVGRYGGEEFIILLPETGTEGAQITAERLCRRIEAEQIEAEPEDIHITVSVGVASLGGRITALEILLNQADQAMYRAKEAGRNRIAY